MVLVAGLFGIVAGWVITLASDWLPRFSQERVDVKKTKNHQPAFWQVFVKGERPVWWKLHLGTEILTGLVVAVAFSQYGNASDFWFLLTEVIVFILIAVIDAKYRLILNVITYPSLGIFFLADIFLLRQSPLHVILGASLAFSIFYLTAVLKPGELGFGDVKLATVIGITFGFPSVLWAFLLGAGAGGIVAIYLLIKRRAGLKTTIPYAPFLCFGAVVFILIRPLFGTA
jgi:leader peptidase (prepilin peptidase)/N-methyltransferase